MLSNQVYSGAVPGRRVPARARRPPPSCPFEIPESWGKGKVENFKTEQFGYCCS